jgi:hypothetical protein
MTETTTGPVAFSRSAYQRHAEIEAGNVDVCGDIYSVEITRAEARRLAAALLEYADSVDPGPGAPYPLPRPITYEEEVEHYQRWNDLIVEPMRQAFAATLDEMLGLAPTPAAGPVVYDDGTPPEGNAHG